MFFLLVIAFMVFAYLMLKKHPDGCISFIDRFITMLPDFDDNIGFLKSFAILISLMAFLLLMARIILRG